ncbi:MAG: hypothetical protein QOK36_4082 [Gaiellales bacterium]|jgi:hypothetical protein|nr:hypothetical protein [Gaiellales bacterium]
MLLAVIGLLVLAVAVVALVAWPLVHERGVETAAPDARRLALLERRDAALAALLELDLDHRAGKLTDEDAERERTTLRDEAVGALAELERLDAESRPPSSSSQPEGAVKPPA